MDFYPYIIKIYIQKKTIKQYETLEEFHNDLNKFGYEYMYDCTHEDMITVGKLNEVDFTFLICKLIDEGEYLSAYSAISSNMRYNNQQIQNKFKEHIEKHPKEFEGKISEKSLQETIRYELFRGYVDEDLQIPFNCMLTDTPLYKKEADIQHYFDDLGKIVDLDRVIYYKSDISQNDVDSYVYAISSLEYQNQRWAVSTLIKKDAVCNLETLRLVALYRNTFDHEETKIYNQLSDKFLGLADLRKENQELKAKNLELQTKLNEITKLL